MPRKVRKTNYYSDDDEDDDNEEENPDVGVPPMTQFTFKGIQLDEGYRRSLPPFYTEKQILDAFHGKDKFHPCQEEYLEMMEEEMSSPSSGESWKPNDSGEEEEDDDDDSLSEYDECDDEDDDGEEEESSDDDDDDNNESLGIRRPTKKQKGSQGDRSQMCLNTEESVDDISEKGSEDQSHLLSAFKEPIVDVSDESSPDQ